MPRPPKQPQPDALFWTPVQVGRLLGVCDMTIVTWCNQGRIESTRTAGNHRRISRPALVDYLRRARQHDALVWLGVPDPGGVLVVGGNPALRQHLGRQDLRRPLAFAESWFHAGLLAKALAPAVVVLDFSLGRLHALEAARRLPPPRPYLVALVYEDEASYELPAQQVCDAVLTYPFEASQLAEKIREGLA